MCTEPHRWHYDYSRLAWDAGFCFDSYKTQKVFDRNGIALLDIERIIRERDIAIVDHHIQNILQYKLDIEETRILDPNFVKLFRLSQLAVEYLTYCKKYLDSTIAVIKQDLQKANEENTELKHDLVNYQSEIHKWRKKVKDLKCTLLVHRKYQPPVASCLSEGVATFQCSVCSKVFVNDEYLKSHVSRRHSSIELEPKLEIIVNNQYKAETDRLQMEIKELKEKLNSRERYFKNEEEKSKETNEVQSDEYYKRMEKLHDEFEQFKAQYEAEMKTIRKGEQDKLMEKILERLDTNSTKAEVVKEDAEREKTPVQSEEQSAVIVQSKVEENGDLKCKTDAEIDKSSVEETIEDVSTEAGEIRAEPQRIGEEQARVETKEVEQKEIRDTLTKVKEEVGKELEEKTKQDIEKLGDQLSEQMSDTFGQLQSRMDTFWHKLQEISVQRENTVFVTATQRITPPTPKIRTELTQITTSSRKESFSNSSTQNSEESETESNGYEPEIVTASSRPAPTPVQRATNAVMEELKTKMKETATKTQRSNAQKVFSKAVVQKATVSSAESESTASESEETRSESEAVVQQLRKTSVIGKNSARPKAEVLQRFRQLVEEEFDERQRELGLDPEWARLPDRTLKQKLEVLTHQRVLMEKEIPELSDIRENIIQKYDIQFANTKTTESANLERDITPRPSRFKSLFLNMKNKAKSMIRQERPSTVTTGVYKLTVHRDVPEQNLPKPTNKSPKPVMYESESENPSEPETKPRKVVQKLRKTKSETNILADKPTEMIETTNSTMVRSLSTLDSILEVKRQLSNVQESEASSELVAEENCRVENVSTDMESEDCKEERQQKSALKNYPCTVKKKVLFDLNKDEQNVEIHNERNINPVVDKRFVKPNTMFHTDDSSSIDSDILDFHKTEMKKPGSGDTISTKALINVSGKAQDDGSDWDISDIVK